MVESTAGQVSDPKVEEANADLLAMLRRYKPTCEVDARHRDFIVEFVSGHEHPFSRNHAHAHLTGSALVVNETGTRVLLGFHRKLGMWLQFGGHGEPGETDPALVALREAREESGIHGLRLHPGAPAPYDVDVHEIPARPDCPAHLHLDIRFLAVAPAGSSIQHQVEEQEQVQWFTWNEAQALEIDASLRRMLEKARSLVAK